MSGDELQISLLDRYLSDYVEQFVAYHESERKLLHLVASHIIARYHRAVCFTPGSNRNRSSRKPLSTSIILFFYHFFLYSFHVKYVFSNKVDTFIFIFLDINPAV